MPSGGAPAQVGTLATRRRLSRGTGEYRSQGLAPRPTSTAGARRSGPLCPSVRRVGARRRLRLWVSASPRPRAALGGGCSWRPRRAGHTFRRPLLVSGRSQARRSRGSRGRAVSSGSAVGARSMVHVGLRRYVTAAPEVRTPGIAQDVSRETVAVLDGGRGGRRSGRLDLPDVPDVSRGTRRRCSPARPARRNPRLTRMGRPRPCSAADARRVGHANRPGRPWAAAAFRCSAHRPRMRGCFTWNRRQRPGGRRPSEPDARPVLSDEGQCGGAGDGALSIRPARFHWNRAGPQLRVCRQIRVSGRAGCFTWNLRRCSGGTAPSASDARPDVS